MKHRYTLAGLWFGLMAAACNVGETDKDYLSSEEVMPVTISGLQDTTLFFSQEVTLQPVVSGMDDEKNYIFTWCAYPDKQGQAKRDTLGQEKNLTFTMKYPVGEKYKLVFEVKDKRMDVFVCQQIGMRIVSEYSNGWYVLEDDANGTDFDFISPEGKVTEDMLAKMGQQRLKGKAVQLVYQQGSYKHMQENEDGKSTLLQGLKVLHILSEEDMRTIDAGNFTVYKNFPDVFYEEPESCHPQYACSLGGSVSSDFFLINAGELYSISSITSNVGKVGAAKIGGRHLHPDVLNDGDDKILVFDQENRSFLYTDSYNDALFKVEATDSRNKLQVSPINMNASMHSIIHRTANEGWAIMESIEGEKEYYLADICFSGNAYPFVDFDTINPDRKFLQADVYGAHMGNSFYFAKGNMLSYYQKNASDDKSTEKMNIWSFDSDETISYIQQMGAILVILTNDAAGWNLYRFQLLGEGARPEIEELIEPVWHGKGHARYLMKK